MIKFSSFLLLLCMAVLPCVAQIKIDSGFYHLRNAEPREWSEFPVEAFGKELVITFEVDHNSIPKTLSLRQYDVKLDWILELNGNTLASLYVDEKDLIEYHMLDRGFLKIGTNTLRVYSKEAVADDIRVGDFRLYPKDLVDIMMETALELEVVDENQKLIPAHVTIVNHERVLQSFARDKGPYAARPGHIYTSTGKINVVLPAGKYTVFAGRGFEYGVDSLSIELSQGDSLKRKLTIRHEVNTEGWICSDTHVHTETYSQHGDATERERVITLAGEGIELPIITDHNQHIDLSAVAKRNQVDKYFTLVIGNEVTSKVGHFNVFPIDSTESVKSSTPPNWTGLRANIEKYRRPKVIILNHARDIHNDFRPHDRSKFLAIAGQRLDGEPIFSNAIEVVNSGSQQSDWMQLFDDWMRLLNGGHELTPIGSSDSHDVSRFIVGQGRTYIRANDAFPNSININEVVDHFLNGKVMVSCGLLTSLKVNDQFGPGETAPGSDHVTAEIEVSGPSWTNADNLVLYINGEKFKEQKINAKNMAGTKWKGKWTLPKSQHDYHVVAIAEGPGDNMIFWPLAKPYQPTSPDWKPRVIGASGAVWVDADRNGKRESANDYARAIVEGASGDIQKIITALQGYDESVAIQVAAILHLEKVDLNSKETQKALKKGSEETQSGFDKVSKELILLKNKN